MGLSKLFASRFLYALLIDSPKYRSPPDSVLLVLLSLEKHPFTPDG